MMGCGINFQCHSGIQGGSLAVINWVELSPPRFSGVRAVNEGNFGVDQMIQKHKSSITTFGAIYLAVSMVVGGAVFILYRAPPKGTGRSGRGPG